MQTWEKGCDGREIPRLGLLPKFAGLVHETKIRLGRLSQCLKRVIFTVGSTEVTWMTAIRYRSKWGTGLIYMIIYLIVEVETVGSKSWLKPKPVRYAGTSSFSGDSIRTFRGRGEREELKTYITHTHK